MYKIQKIITPLPEQASFEAKNFEQMVDKEFFITLLAPKTKKKIVEFSQELNQVIPLGLEPKEGVIYEVISRRPKYCELFLLGEIKEAIDAANKPFSSYIFRDLSEDYIFKIEKGGFVTGELPVLEGRFNHFDLWTNYISDSGDATITLGKIFPYKKKFRISLLEQKGVSFGYDYD